jgi:hypothetical protein
MNTKSHNTMRRSQEMIHLCGDRRAMSLACQ